MSAGILFAGGAQEGWDDYAPELRRALDATGVDYTLAQDMPAEAVHYIVFAPGCPIEDFSTFPSLKAVLRLWAGVEDVIGNDTITVPICRMVDPGMTQGMVEYVVAHVMRHHMETDRHVLNQNGTWKGGAQHLPLAKDRRVCIMGIGALGSACASALAGLGFDVTGWSRTQKSLEGVRCLSGPAEEALDGQDIVVLLTPLTEATANLLNADTLARLATGAKIINPGRGGLIDDDALLAALESGQVSHATLDTFRVEPLPEDHPFWSHPQVTVTPHIASETRTDTASAMVAENVRRGETGVPFINTVDRAAGY